MTTSPAAMYYPTIADRLLARLGRALVAWADERATITHERQIVAVENQRAARERERSATASQYLRG